MDGVDIAPGTVVGGYTVRRKLGGGGMGAVYLVRHPTLPRDVALKVLHPGLATAPAMQSRFQREAELLSRLSHPNIVDVLDRGQQGDLLWMAMQFVSGPDVAAVLEERGAMPPEHALGSSRPSGTPSITRTPAACCTGTSSRRTSCSRSSPAAVSG